LSHPAAVLVAGLSLRSYGFTKSAAAAVSALFGPLKLILVPLSLTSAPLPTLISETELILVSAPDAMSKSLLVDILVLAPTNISRLAPTVSLASELIKTPCQWRFPHATCLFRFSC
jgi:hypothetical protein